ncbi:MAG TPA: CPBP family intramembrane glutamic endopeptidase, partial [Anaerolineales bacterium]|nr:CPBP family intramembrane glutamic endopeptidase [Anaerolineales bacterium]
LIGSLFLLGLRRRRWGWERLGLRSFAPVWFLVAFGVGMVVTPLSGIIALVIRRLLALPLESPQLSFLLPQDINLPGGLAMIALAGLVVPLAEELFFRGLLYTWLRGRWGFAPAAAVSALIFGVVHLEPSVAGTAFILGLILAWLYERSGSLWTAVLVHAMNNSIQILLLYALIALGFPMNGI